MKAILQIVGAPQAGKSTLCDALIQELSDASILVIDASEDFQLTQRLTLDQPKRTVSQLVTEWIEQGREMHPQAQEGIDWAFSDLAVSVGNDIDLLTVGRLPDQLSPEVKKVVSYGLNRLMDSYDFILIDGRNSRLYALIHHKEMVRLILVAAPGHFDFDLSAFETFGTPVLILNRMTDGPLPEAFEQGMNDALEQGAVELIGRIPDYADPDERVRELPGVFHNCLYRMDLPITPSSPLNL